MGQGIQQARGIGDVTQAGLAALSGVQVIDKGKAAAIVEPNVPIPQAERVRAV